MEREVVPIIGKERAAFALFALLVIAYTVVRAWTVPFVNDEARAFYLYVLSGNFLPFGATWDAANHPLLSALSQVSWRIGGTAPLALRIWSVLAFIAFTWYGWRMGAWLKVRFVRWCFWAAFLACPLLLDLFGLFRGYGLAMGLLVVALFHVAKFLHEERRKDLLLSLAAVALAGWAMLSLIIVWAAVVGALAYTVLRGRNTAVRAGRLGWCLLLGALPLLIAAVFLWGLKSRELLYSGTDAGYLDGTVRSLSIFVLGTAQRAWRLAICLALAAAAVLAFWPSSAQRSMREELARLAAFLLLADVLGREFLFFTSHALFPIDRGALHLLPLSILLVACTVDRLAEKLPLLAYAALPLLFLPFRSVATANLDSTLIWGGDAIPDRFHALVEQRQRVSDRPLIVAGSPFLREAWNFGALMRHSPSITLDYLDLPQPVCDLLLIDTVHFDAPPGFRTIATTSTGENRLMERIVPLRMHEVLDTSVTRPLSSDEFVTLWQPTAAAWRGRAAWVEVYAELTTEERCTGMELVLDIRDTVNAQLAYRNVRIDQHRLAKDGAVHVSVRVPRTPASMGRLTVFLYDPDKVPFRLDRARVKVREILPDEGQ
ncbi:MAG: hypothetical protein IPN44_11615 [Flavobacteriales bacterium]|nr:hypothetical protein [Flavobacteriales bacterium]